MNNTQELITNIAKLEQEIHLKVLKYNALILLMNKTYLNTDVGKVYSYMEIKPGYEEQEETFDEFYRRR